jgi:hypothetical protein
MGLSLISVSAPSTPDQLVTQLTDSQLYEIAARGLTETNLVPKALPARGSLPLSEIAIDL